MTQFKKKNVHYQNKYTNNASLSHCWHNPLRHIKKSKRKTTLSKSFTIVRTICLRNFIDGQFS